MVVGVLGGEGKKILCKLRTHFSQCPNWLIVGLGGSPECIVDVDTIMTRTRALDPWETDKDIPHIGQTQNWQSPACLQIIDQCVSKLAAADSSSQMFASEIACLQTPTKIS